MVRPRRALDASQRSSPLRRVIVIFTVPLLVIGAIAAGVALAAQQNLAGAQRFVPGAAPEGNNSSSTTENRASTPAETDKAISNCRREVARAESVLESAGPGLKHWRETVDAQTNLELERISEDEAKGIWKRTRSAGPTDIAKYQTAKGAYQSQSACGAVIGASDAAANQLETCRARLEKVTSALGAADRAIRDWERHLADMRQASDEYQAEELWEAAWKRAPANLDKYSAAMDTLAKTKSCPR